MIVYDKEQKQIVIPNGLGNVNIVINQGGDCPECPELTEISITENGRYEGAYNVVNVDVPTEGGDKPTPPQDGWGMTGVFNSWGATPDILFNENGEWEGRPYKVIRNFEATGGEFKIRRNNDSTDSYSANFYDIPQFALLRKDYELNMSIDDGVWDVYLFFGNDGVPKEMLILHTGTDLSTIKYEYTLNVSTDKENAIIDIFDGYTDMTDTYYGSATVTMKLGNSYSIGIYMEGYEDIYEELACRNDEERNYTLTKSEGGEGGESGSVNLISPIVFSKEAGNTINAENVQIPTFVYEGNQYYNMDIFNLADIEEFKIHILFKPNNSGAEDPINVFGCEDSDWDNTTFGARIYQGQIYFRMSGQDVASSYTENTWYDVDMGYNATKRWVIVNRETLLETEHTSFDRPRQTLMIGAINSGGNAFRPFYGKIATIYIESNGNQIWLLPKNEGYMDVYWNDKGLHWIQISGENNARFENDYMSGDGMKSITWLGNLEDKWVTPSMNDRDSNGYIVVSPSEGYSGLKRTVINPQTIYNEGLEAGRAEGGGDCPECPEGGCTLTSRTITSNGVYHPEPEQMKTIWFTVDKPSAYDTGVKLVDNSWVEIYFRATAGGDTPTLIGCEDYDWTGTTFATRWYDNNLGVRIGLNEIGIPYTAGDDKLHKLKFGKTVGVWFDGVKVSDIAGEKWVPTDRTLYIGAMNNLENNNENGFWRPWVGYIGDVTVYGSLNETVREYHFKAGDYGRGGEFKRVEDNTNLPNLGGDSMATVQTQQYGEAPDGYNEIVVNVPDLNGSYDEGYDQGKTDTVANAKVLDVAKNGQYGDGKTLYKTINVNVVPQVSIKEAGLNVWYNDLKRITDENEQINSDWDQALQGETIQNVFPGISMTISGQAVAKPFFINAVNGDSTATRIGKLVSNAYGTPKSCAVVIIGAFDCKNIQNVDLEAFKYMTDLCYIYGMNGLGESFISPQTINFTYCTNLFIKGNTEKFIHNFAESLFDLSAGNKNGLNTSTLKFKNAVQERSENADAIALMRSKGWTVEFVSSDL